ncbi:MAG: ABC transporter ATP-binding protein [Cyclobacteriaceae bacterium]|nr:ABC transporter ATP-binding protein [Cyclobacteriaceae bacterium]
MENVLKIEGLTKNFGRLCAVNNLSLEVKRGQVFGMLGPNGSGKTTTLGMLMGVTNPTSGSFSWFGQPPTHELRRKIGAVLEHPIFYPYLTGQQNLELMSMIKQSAESNIAKVLETVELTSRRNDKYKTYSLGMKQRLAIASALLNDPIVLILDEPTNGLDPQGIAEIREIIKKIANDGKTIILASHLLDEVQKVCSHFAILRKGSLVHYGPVVDVGKGEELVEVTAHRDDLISLLESFEGTMSVKREDEHFLVRMKGGFHSENLNQYLFDKGIVATHLVTQKKSLEKQFLEILAEADHAALIKN